eukprot:174938_1
MFARLFGPKFAHISRNTVRLDQSILTKCLILIQETIDALLYENLTNDCNDGIIIINSPYSIGKSIKSIQDALYIKHMSYISPMIISLLFGNQTQIQSKLRLNKINHIGISKLTKKMSIIIIDLSSSQHIAMPPNISALCCNNSNNSILRKNNGITNNDWTIEWCYKSNTFKISDIFVHIMNTICKTIQSSQYNKYFEIENKDIETVADSWITAIKMYQDGSIVIEKKIQILKQKSEDALKRAKQFDKKSALDELKKKNAYDNEQIKLEGKLFSFQHKITVYQEILTNILKRDNDTAMLPDVTFCG